MSRRASNRGLANRTRHDGQRGFALLEILVGFVVLALGLGAISTGIAVAMRSDGRTQSMQVALRLAQSRLEAAGISEKLAPGYREGRAENYRWQETITTVPIGTKPPEPQGDKPSPPAATTAIGAYWIEIAVQGADGTVARLAALKLAPGAGP
jgi:type II secretory pathway pseudopilin PulG